MTCWVTTESNILNASARALQDVVGKASITKVFHFIGLNNSSQLEGMGSIGDQQMAWLNSDVGKLGASTPIVVFAHIPCGPPIRSGAGPRKIAPGARPAETVRLCDGAQRAYSSGDAEGGRERDVSFRDVDGIPATLPPGSAPSAGPMKVPAEKLREVLGIRNVNFVAGSHHLAVVDSRLDQV